MSISPTSPLGALSSLLSSKPLSGGLTSVDAKSVEQTFLDYAQMTPAERMHAAMLGQLGLTEEEFQAMDPAAQREVAQKIQEMIRQQAEKTNDQRTGLIADMTV